MPSMATYSVPSSGATCVPWHAQDSDKNMSLRPTARSWNTPCLCWFAASVTSAFVFSEMSWVRRSLENRQPNAVMDPTMHKPKVWSTNYHSKVVCGKLRKLKTKSEITWREFFYVSNEVEIQNLVQTWLGTVFALGMLRCLPDSQALPPFLQVHVPQHRLACNISWGCEWCIHGGVHLIDLHELHVVQPPLRDFVDKHSKETTIGSGNAQKKNGDQSFRFR